MQDYLNTDEIESVLANLAATDARCRLVPLPEPTSEGRRCHALHLSTAPREGRPVAMVVSGIHAREWLGCDAVITFVVDLLRALDARAGLRYGSKVFTRSRLQQILQSKDLVVFPLVNPDGRHYSQMTDGWQSAGWRKNRRLQRGGGHGVDINRNFPTAWDFERMFVAGASDSSAREGDETYHGSESLSEEETRNVDWLLRRFQQTRWLVDVHGPAGVITYNWGIDDTQSSAPDQSHREPRWDCQRGVHADSYGEYRPMHDADFGRICATRMSEAVLAVWGRKWAAKQAFDTFNAASGMLTDYAYARGWPARSTSLRPIHGFVIEYAPGLRPVPPELGKVVDEVCAALFEFCLAVG